jgi:hypothetical protein
MIRRWRRWALIVWTGTAISTGVVARFTFAAPQPSLCDANTDALCLDLHFEWLWYVLIILVWLVGLAVITVVVSIVGSIGARRRGRAASRSVRPQRRWLRGAVIAGSIACMALPFGVWALTAVGSQGGSPRHANAPPAGVLVCRDPIRGPEALGGWQCPSNSDIGRAPIESPQSLMCVSDLSDVKNATVGIQIVYDGRLVTTRHLHSSDSSTEAYVVLDQSFYPALATRSGLRPGHYRCRFLARGRLVHDRAFIVTRVAATRPARLVLPHLVERISFIPHSLFDPGSADKIARRSRYSAWVRLGNDHTADVGVWPSRSAAVQAVRIYRKRGPDTKPLDAPPWPGRVVRVDRFKNVTVAWYTRPTRGDRAAFKRALLVPHGGDQYTRLSIIPRALMDASTSGSTQDAPVEATIVLDRCDRHACTETRFVEVAIWPSESAAQSYYGEHKDVSDEGPFERVKNATISWNYDPTSAERAAVMSALH